MDKEKLEELMFSDCRVAENMDKLKSVLHNLPPYKKISGEIPLVKLEKLIKYLFFTFEMPFSSIYGILVDSNSSNTLNIYHVTLYSPLRDKHHSIYASDLYEAMAKVAIFLFYSRGDKK